MDTARVIDVGHLGVAFSASCSWMGSFVSTFGPGADAGGIVR